MRFAYALLCHKNPEQINLLIDILNTGKDSFFIHLDAKADFLDKIRKGENIYFSEKRIDVKWGHHSQMEAFWELSKLIKKQGAQYDYIWFLSGQDFPIKSRVEIETFMKKNEGKQFLEIYHQEKEINFQEKEINWRVKYYYPSFCFKQGCFWKSLAEVYYKIIRKFKLKRKYSFPPLYRGSQWFTITMDCFLYVLDYLDKNPDYFKAFKYSFCGDEIFFITLIKNSPFGSSVINNNLREIVWMGGNNPKTFTIKDYEYLIQSPNFFGRKFDLDADPEIINKLLGKVKF